MLRVKRAEYGFKQDMVRVAQNKPAPKPVLSPAELQKVPEYSRWGGGWHVPYAQINDKALRYYFTNAIDTLSPQQAAQAYNEAVNPIGGIPLIGDIIGNIPTDAVGKNNALKYIQNEAKEGAKSWLLQGLKEIAVRKGGLPPTDLTGAPVPPAPAAPVAPAGAPAPVAPAATPTDAQYVTNVNTKMSTKDFWGALGEANKITDPTAKNTAEVNILAGLWQAGSDAKNIDHNNQIYKKC